MNFAKASISGKEVSCDVCGKVVERGEIISVYYGPNGEKTDYCLRCFENAK